MIRHPSGVFSNAAETTFTVSGLDSLAAGTPGTLSAEWKTVSADYIPRFDAEKLTVKARRQVPGVPAAERVASQPRASLSSKAAPRLDTIPSAFTSPVMR